MTINELLEKRKAKWEAMNAFLNTHRNEKGVLSAEDDKLYSAMETEMVELTNEIERMNRAAALEKIMSKPVTEPITLKPMSSDDHKEDKTGRSSKAYKDALMKALRTNFRSISNVLQENVDTDGGYLVPEEIDSRLIEKLETENIIRLLGTSIETSGDHKINIAASKPAAAWTDEGETITFDDAKFSQILLDAHKLCVAVKVTEELLYDSAFDLENYLTSAFAKALANAEENAFLNGNGIGKPLGIFANTGGAEIGVTTSGNTPNYDEIINLVYSLKRPYRKNAAFIMNDSTIAVIRKLKDGNGSYIWQPSSVAGEPDKILGYPVYTSAYVPEIAAGNKVIAFGDFSYYNIGDRGTRSFSQLKELFAGNGLVGFVAKERVDGKLVLPEAVKVLKIKD
jgi:HK97 family phage major capsid protein